MNGFKFAFPDSPFGYETQPGQYPWRLMRHLDIRIPGADFRRHAFLERGNMLGEIWGSRLRIFPGYAINGCSPSWVIGKLRLGTPTPKSSLPAAFAHDFLYQFLPLPCCPWSREDADAALLALLDHEGFPLGLTYYSAVRVFGGFFAQKRGTNTNISCLQCATP
jgi:hypothetical protein